MAIFSVIGSGGAIGAEQVSALQNIINQHIDDKDNPHNITIEQITNNKIYIDENGNVHFVSESEGEDENPESSTILINNQPVATQDYVEKVTTIDYNEIAFDVNEII